MDWFRLIQIKYNSFLIQSNPIWFCMIWFCCLSQPDQQSIWAHATITFLGQIAWKVLPERSESFSVANGLIVLKWSIKLIVRRLTLCFWIIGLHYGHWEGSITHCSWNFFPQKSSNDMTVQSLKPIWWRGFKFQILLIMQQSASSYC